MRGKKMEAAIAFEFGSPEVIKLVSDYQQPWARMFDTQTHTHIHTYTHRTFSFSTLTNFINRTNIFFLLKKANQRTMLL
jgi:hypothetical protein